MNRRGFLGTLAAVVAYRPAWSAPLSVKYVAANPVYHFQAGEFDVIDTYAFDIYDEATFAWDSQAGPAAAPSRKRP